MSREISFSAIPDAETSPCWAPPYPGSMTTYRTDRGNATRSRGRGGVPGTRGVWIDAIALPALVTERLTRSTGTTGEPAARLSMTSDAGRYTRIAVRNTLTSPMGNRRRGADTLMILQ